MARTDQQWRRLVSRFGVFLRWHNRADHGITVTVVPRRVSLTFRAVARDLLLSELWIRRSRAMVLLRLDAGTGSAALTIPGPTRASVRLVRFVDEIKKVLGGTNRELKSLLQQDWLHRIYLNE